MRILVSERLMLVVPESFSSSFRIFPFVFGWLRAPDSGLWSADNARFVDAVEDDMRAFTNSPAVCREIGSVRSILVILPY